MLAQTFKTPADLGLSDVEFDGLVRALGMLDRNEIVFAPVKLRAGQIEFNMGPYYDEESSCGTIACFVGLAYFSTGKRAFAEIINGGDTPNYSDKLNTLIYAWGVEVSRDEVTPSQAAAALRNYLTHGEPRWDEAMNA